MKFRCLPRHWLHTPGSACPLRHDWTNFLLSKSIQRFRHRSARRLFDIVSLGYFLILFLMLLSDNAWPLSRQRMRSWQRKSGWRNVAKVRQDIHFDPKVSCIIRIIWIILAGFTRLPLRVELDIFSFLRQRKGFCDSDFPRQLLISLWRLWSPKERAILHVCFW